jgi:protein arginine kinase activator
MTTCDKCDQPAIYHDVRILNGVHNTTHLCATHAIEAGINLGPIELSLSFSESDSSSIQDNSPACPDCGMTIAQYKEVSLLGCPTCYETFETELEMIIAKVQDNHTQHVGRSPSGSNTQINRHLQIRRLLKQLESAVFKEEYEEAAQLRDQLREIHQAGETDAN